jgi:hypothetical protein
VVLKISTIPDEGGGDQTTIAQTSCPEITQSQFEGLCFSKLRPDVSESSYLLYLSNPLSHSQPHNILTWCRFYIVCSNSDPAQPTTFDFWLCCFSLPSDSICDSFLVFLSFDLLAATSCPFFFYLAPIVNSQFCVVVNPVPPLSFSISVVSTPRPPPRVFRPFPLSCSTLRNVACTFFWVTPTALSYFLSQIM